MLKLPTSGNESVNARYLAKYDANAASSASAASGRYYDHNNRHNSNNTRNVMASSTMKSPQNNSDLQHLRSWIQQKYIVKCWYVGEGSGDEEGIRGSSSTRRKIMPANKVHRPTASLSSLPKPTSSTTSNTLHSTTVSHDDSFFDAIASSSTSTAAMTIKVDDASSWDAFGGSSSSPAAFQADFGDFSGHQQQQQHPPPQLPMATMVSLPPVTPATGGRTMTTPTFQATFNQEVASVVSQNMMMQGDRGSFVADFSSMPQPQQQPQMQPQQQHQLHSSPTQPQSFQGFASFPTQQPQQQYTTQQGQVLQPEMHGGMGGGRGGTSDSAQLGMGDGFHRQQSQPHPISQQSQLDQSSFANFSSTFGQPVATEDAITASMPPSNPNAFKAVESDKMSAFDAFDGLSLEPTPVTTTFGFGSSEVDSSTNATIQVTGANETKFSGDEQTSDSGSIERSVFTSVSNVISDNETIQPNLTMSINVAINNHPLAHPETEMLMKNDTFTTAVENTFDDDSAAAALCQETTHLLQQLSFHQLMQVHQLVSSMTSHLPAMSPPHDMSTEYLSINGIPKMGMEESDNNRVMTIDAMNDPAAGVPTPSPPPVLSAPSNALPPVEKEGNPFDF